MNINNPKNELYQDFVQLVDNVSTAIVKESIVPIAGQMTTASESMEQSANQIQEMSKTILEIHKNTSMIQTEINTVSLILSNKIDKELKVIMGVKFSLMETKFNELHQKNINLESQITKSQEKQALFFYSTIGIIALCGFIVIYMLKNGIN